MRNIRFPSKERVQEQHHKTFVLLQAAVGCPDIKDFALRIEQAEMVDVASRLLKGLLELAIHRHWGMLLECVVLLERALRTRLWEGSHSCQFIQCHDLSSSTIKTLCDRGIRNVNEIYGSSIAQVQQLIGCSPQEARILIHFSASVHRSKLVAEMVVDTDGKLRIEVKRAELGNDIVGLQAIAFILLCYDVKTGQLVCFRRLQAGCTGAVFAVTVPDVHEALGRLRCRLLGNLVGADVCVGAQIPTDDTFQPDATSTKAKPRDPNPSIAVGKSQHKAAAKALPSVDQGDECIEGPSQHDQPCYVPWKDTYLKAGPLLDRIPNPTTPSLPLLARNLPAITKPIPVNMSARIVHAMMPSPASQRCEQPLSSPTVANKRLFFEFNCPDDDATPASKAICLHHKQPSKQSEDDFQPNAKAVQSQGAHPVSQVAMKKATMLQDLQVATKIQDQLFSAAFM